MKYNHLGLLFFIFTFTHHLNAREFRVAQLPNGARYQCMNCHLNPLGGAVNVFGLDVFRNLSGQNVNWPAICALDSDADGFSNGRELGDPNCTWVAGPAMITDLVSNPGDRFSKPIVMMDMQIQADAMVQDMLLVDMQIQDQFIDIVDLFTVDAYQGDSFSTQGGVYIQDVAIQQIADQMMMVMDQGLNADQNMIDLNMIDQKITDQYIIDKQIIDQQIKDQKISMENTEDMGVNATGVSATTPKSGCQQSQNQSWYILGFLLIFFNARRNKTT